MIERFRSIPSKTLLKIVGAIYGFGVLFSLLFGVQEVARLSFIVLFLTIIAVLVYSIKKITKLQVIILVLIGATGLISEIIGVRTGIIFGDYVYVTGLGPKIFSVPILLAGMWVIVSWYGLAVYNAMKKSAGLLAVIIAAWAVLIYDIFLEPFATAANLWIWNQGTVPILNYITWFVLALVFVFVLVRSKIRQENGQTILAIAGIQILYFCVISLIFTVQ
jgi:putative membrane protein